MKNSYFVIIVYIIFIRIFFVGGVTKCESRVELRAVLLSCPTKDSGCEDDDPLTQAMNAEEAQILHANPKNFESLKEEREKGFPNTVKDCKRKLVITLKMKNVGKIPCDDEYIVVDHVFDPVTGGKGRLLSPVVLKLRQEQMIQLYGLQFQRVVNSDPFEEQKETEETCSVDPATPTCGVVVYNGKPLPFSQGFCCSSDPLVNANRESELKEDSVEKFFEMEDRLVREKKSPVEILNPDLIEIKPEADYEITSEGNENPFPEEEKNSLIKELSEEKIPNFLIEGDRKIVCGREDFLIELCKLQDEKSKGRVENNYNAKIFNKIAFGNSFDSKSNNAKQKSMFGNGKRNFFSGGAKAAVTEKDISSFGGLFSKTQSNYIKESEGIKNMHKFQEEFSQSKIPWNQDLGETEAKEINRDKRENEQMSKTFELKNNANLKDRLDTFFKLKHSLKKRRKRLLDLPLRRYRQSDVKCQSGGECQTIKAPYFPRENSGKAEPPQYFFCHDKFIIHPQASQRFASNSSIVVSQEVEPVNRLHKEQTDENSSVDASEKLQPNENKFKNNEKLKENIMIVKESRNKEKEINGVEVKAQGNTIKNAKSKEYLEKNGWANNKQILSIDRNEKERNVNKKKNHFNERESGITSKGDNRATSGISDKHLSHKSYSDKTNGKSVLRSENNDRVSKSKMRNFLISQSRERQKPEVNSAKNFEIDTLKQSALKDILAQHEGKSKEIEIKDEAKIDDKNMALKPMDKASENFERENTLESSKTVQSFDRSSLGNVEKTFLKSNSKAPSPASTFGDASNMDFSVEIVRQQYPKVSDFHLPSLHAEQSLGRRINTPRHHIETKVYDVENELSRRIPFRGRSSQKYRMIANNGRFGYSRGNGPVDDYWGYYRQRSNEQPHPIQFPISHWNRNYHRERWKDHNHRTVEKHHHSHPFDQTRSSQVLRQDFLSGRQNENHPNEHRFTGRNSYQENKNFREQKSDKIRIKRTSAYSFEAAKGFFGSEFPDLKESGFRRLKNPKIVHRLEACERFADAEDISNVPLWRFPQKDTLGSFTLSDFSLSLDTFNKTFLHSDRDEKTKIIKDKERLAKSYIYAPVEREPAFKGKRQAKETKVKTAIKGSGEKDKFAGEYIQDTAHCLRFGDLWYSVYSIKKPMVAQIVGVQLFDKRTLCDGTAQWRDLTKGKMVRIGTFLPKAEDDLPTISVTYMGGKTKKVDSAIDPDNYFLLIPSHVSDPSRANNYPQFEGGPAEYLLVESKDISSGRDCNMVGTSFEAFVRRADRCSENRGSCLKRQPIDLWREDMEARIRGKRGKYFVENFGTVSNSPVKTFTNLTGEFLALEYYGDYASIIEIEVKADSNAVIRKGSTAQIPCVYIDSTYPKKTRIILSVLNIGLTSSYFRPRLGDCPPNLDTAWCPLEGPLVTIPPQQRHDFKLDLSGVLPSNKIRVTVQVLNQFNKKVAYRKITIKNGDRCVCAFHCECNCVGNLIDGRTCRKLSLQEYREAGYLGSFPFRGGAATSASESIRSNIHIVFVTAAYVLLLFGIIKGVLGVFFRRLGIAGTRVIVGPRKLCRYYECELQFCSVLLDECGFPIHPTTYAPVQIVPLWAEIVINFFFFFLYPLRGLCFLISSSPCCKAACPGCDGCCSHDDDFEYDKCSRPLLSKNVQPTCVNYNLTTLNATKQEADEYLPYSPYKGDDDPLEEDDTDFVLREMKRYRNK